MKFLVKDAYQVWRDLHKKGLDQKFHVTISSTELVLKNNFLTNNNSNRFYLEVLPKSIFYICPITFISLAKVSQYILEIVPYPICILLNPSCSS